MSELDGPMSLDELAWDLWAMHDRLIGLSEHLDDARLMRLTVAAIIMEHVCDEITDEAITNPGLGTLDRREMQTRNLQETSGNLLSLLASITYRRTMSGPRTPVQSTKRTSIDWIIDARNALVRGEQLEFPYNRPEWDADPECPFDAGRQLSRKCPDDPCPMPCADISRWDGMVAGTSGDVPGMGREA
jgi:hypothetical protein